MFILELCDRKGNALNIGDVVKISNGSRIQFYAEVKYLEDRKAITPFHTFSFHSFEKIDTLPDTVVKSSEERYNIWYDKDPLNDDEQVVKEAEKYLMDWRQCEHLLEHKCYRIQLLPKQGD
jgi:hypothetical protein